MKNGIHPELTGTAVSCTNCGTTFETRSTRPSSQVPLDSEGRLVGEGDFDAQTRQVFENLTRALEAADAGWSDVVKLNYFLTDVSHIASVRAIRDEYVHTKRPPASTLVQVSGLFRPDVLVEIEAVAVRA